MDKVSYPSCLLIPFRNGLTTNHVGYFPLPWHKTTPTFDVLLPLRNALSGRLGSDVLIELELQPATSVTKPRPYYI